jgi:hypothetical protein
MRQHVYRLYIPSGILSSSIIMESEPRKVLIKCGTNRRLEGKSIQYNYPL